MILAFIGIIFNMIILSYFYTNKKCTCLKNKLEGKIQTISVILLLLYTLLLIIFISKIKSPKLIIIIPLVLTLIGQIYQIPLLLKNTNTKKNANAKTFGRNNL